MRDFRLWWALFVFFGVLCVLALQHGYRRWRRVRSAIALVPGVAGADRERHLRREGWRLASMAVSLVVMTALVFAALLGAPAALLLGLRATAVVAVVGVIALSIRR
jgi:hypothetical protein